MTMALAPERMGSICRFGPLPTVPKLRRLDSHLVSFTPRCQIDIKVKVEKSIYKYELEAAIDVVERACRLCLSVQRGLHANNDESAPQLRLEKSDASPVTVADLGVQALVSLGPAFFGLLTHMWGVELGLLFPSITLVGEEDSRMLREDLNNYQKKSSTQGQPLVETVAQAVTSVASAKFNGVTTESILNALDRGVISVTETAPSRISYWILDPIDGTRGFLKGGDALYVVGLALVVEGEIVVGVMGCPNIRYTYDDKLTSGAHSLQIAALQQTCKGSSAEGLNAAITGDYQSGLVMAACSGCGCWVKPLSRTPLEPDKKGSRHSKFQNMVQCKVDICKSMREASYCISDNEEWGTLPLTLALASVSAFEDRLPEHEAQILPLCCGSLCKYFAIALGGASVFVQYVQGASPVKVWDHAAGVICVVEAGGQVTDVQGTAMLQMLGNGQPLVIPEGGAILVSNGSLHDIILRSLAAPKISSE